MFRIRQDLCAGCGLCAENCPREAIFIELGLARIDRAKCNGCGSCLDVCPRGAIVEMVAVSRGELGANISSLKNRTNELIDKIERLRSAGKANIRP
jgi:ferredoxin